MPDPAETPWTDTAAVLFDIDGVLAVSWEPIDGAAEAVRAVRGAGIPVRFVTNTTSRPRTEIADALRGIGVELDDDDVLTATRATASYLRRHHPDDACLVLSSGDVGDDLGELRRADDPDRAGVVVLGGAGPEFDYDRLNAVFRALDRGAAFVAMHRNLHWRTAAGDQLDTGAFVAGLEAASGVEAVVTGKPAPAFFDAALDSLGAAPDARPRTVMVGDDVVSDVLGAQQCGLRGVLVRTGKYRTRDVERAEADGRGRPDVVVDSVADLPALLDAG